MSKVKLTSVTFSDKSLLAKHKLKNIDNKVKRKFRSFLASVYISCNNQGFVKQVNFRDQEIAELFQFQDFAKR